MTEAILLVLGAVALIAAIVGGGVKYKDIEVGHVPSLWRQSLLGAAGLMLLVIGIGLLFKDKLPMAGWPGADGNEQSLNSSESVTDQAQGNNSSSADDTGATNQTMEANASAADQTVADDVGTADRSLPEAQSNEPYDAAQQVFVRNSCPESVKLWMVYNKQGSWDEAGPWNFTSGESSLISNDNMTVATTVPDVYIFVQSSSGIQWFGDFASRNFKNLMKVRLPVSDNRYFLHLDCPK